MKFFLSICIISITYVGTAQIGINTSNPQETLHVVGSFRVEDGSEANGKVLTGDSNGTGTWDDLSIKNVVADYGGGVDIGATESTYLQTGTSITLPPGTWAVNISMLMVQDPVAITPRDTSVWLRTSFSDSPTSPVTISSDFVGSFHASGNYGGSLTYGLLTGLLILENTSGADKTYYYVAGNTEAYGYSSTPSYTIDKFGGDVYRENNIIAYKIQ